MTNKFYRATLDADHVYWGVEEVDALSPGDVEVPQDCDLKPGHYRHDDLADPPQFVPLARGKKRDTPEAPSMERALFELLAITPNRPAYCEEWMQWYRATFDARSL